jgi:hypothetical protein
MVYATTTLHISAWGLGIAPSADQIAPARC